MFGEFRFIRKRRGVSAGVSPQPQLFKGKTSGTQGEHPCVRGLEAQGGIANGAAPSSVVQGEANDGRPEMLWQLDMGHIYTTSNRTKVAAVREFSGSLSPNFSASHGSDDRELPGLCLGGPHWPLSCTLLPGQHRRRQDGKTAWFEGLQETTPVR